MVYKQYTMRQAVPVMTTHKCSACGRYNITKQYLVSESVYSDKGATQRTLEKRKQSAEDTLKERTRELLQSAGDITADSNFYRLNLNGRCGSCGNVEPWGRTKLTVLEVISTIGGVVAVFDFLFMMLGLLDNHWDLTKLPMHMFIVLGAGLLVFATKYIWVLIQKLRLKNYPAESLPKLIRSEDELAAAAARIAAQAPSGK